MKRIACIFAMALSCSCARYWVSNQMQTDESYMIAVRGNGPASVDGARDEALTRAGQLCPNGYRTRSEAPQDNFKPTFQLVVKCKGDAE